MGRWGHRKSSKHTSTQPLTSREGVFEGDNDLDIAIKLSQLAGVELSKLVHQSDMLCPEEIRAWYQSSEYQPVLEGMIKECRKKLDSGIGSSTFETLVRKASEPTTNNGDYQIILFGALMMRCGAKMTSAQNGYLERLLPRIPAHAEYMLPMFDGGFRLPGKLQFKAALQNYKEGTPRSFQEPR
jgi:hypothetical protein